MGEKSLEVMNTSKVELEYRRLLRRAMTRHGGHIFREYYEEGLTGQLTFEDITKEMVKEMKKYIEDDSWPDARDAARRILQRYQDGDLLGAWLEYFKWYPEHGEGAGLVVGILEKQKKYKEALEILKLCDELSRLEWDT